MDQVRIILSENLTGSDLTNIASKLNISIRTIQNYLAGSGTIKETEDKILNESFTYFCNKYSKLVNDLKIARNED